MPGPALCLSRRLWLKDSTMNVAQLRVMCGSKWGGSPRLRRKTPPRFGVCACAGSAAPAITAAPPMRTSRRVKSQPWLVMLDPPPVRVRARGRHPALRPGPTSRYWDAVGQNAPVKAASSAYACRDRLESAGLQVFPIERLACFRLLVRGLLLVEADAHRRDRRPTRRDAM